eukprot:Colp12_sorted_trinity150504_noHs@10532
MHIQALYGFLFLFFGYTGANSFLQYFFYVGKAKDVKEWKIQPAKTESLSDKGWWLPVFRLKKNRMGPNHFILATFNLLMASTFAGAVVEFTCRGSTGIHFEDASVWWEIFILVSAITYQCVAEYYWHRIMHLPWFYRNFHKIHHYYKSPEPFCDMTIHPLEAFGYYCILYGPCVIFRIHAYTFFSYMVVMGITGVMDHSGVKASFPLLYNTEDHDKHHSDFNVNYSFPFPHMDILHGTFRGTYLGKTYEPSYKVVTQNKATKAG